MIENGYIHKKRKLNKVGIITIISLCFILIGFGIYFCMWRSLQKEEVHVLEQSNNYNMKADYPITKVKSIDKKIQQFIDDKKDEFLAKVEEYTFEGEEKFDFNVNYETYHIKNIEAIYLTLYVFDGGNHYERLNHSYYYNKDTNEEVDITYFLENDKSLSKLSALANYYVMKYSKDNNKDFSEEMVNEGTKADISHYEHLRFLDMGLQILFPPYQVSSWADGEVKIVIPYHELEGIIKPEFRNVEKDIVEEITPVTRDLNQFKGKKLIAFTFDDGPSSKTTNYLLDRLNNYNARVTFFVLGSRVNDNQNVLKRAYEMGNQIGSHTYNHLNLLKLSDYSVLNEIKSTNDIIYKVLGYTPTLLRPPYGNINAHIKSLANMNTILWNDDTLDWKYKDKDKIANEIINNAKDGNIVLLHDIYQSSVEGALLAMEKLQEDGYAFVTIDEMIKLKNITLDRTKSYFNF